MLVGVDISHHNGLVMNALATIDARIQFVICKATEGTSFVDNMFDSNMMQAAEHGFLRGAYHYVNNKDVGNMKLWADVVEEARKEARHFVSHVRPYGDALLALDFEESYMMTQRGVDYLSAVALAVKEMTQTPPLIYASEGIIKQFDFSGCVDIGCGLWVAKWRTNASPDLCNVTADDYVKAMPHEFEISAIQQISSNAVIHGKRYNLDVDIANMSCEAWAKYANPRLY